MQRHRIFGWWIILAAVAFVALPAIAQDDTGEAPPQGEFVSEPAPTAGNGDAQPAQPTEGDQPAEGNGEGDAADDSQEEQQQQQPQGLFQSPWAIVIMVGGFILLYWIMGSGRRKQEAKRREMLAGLSKGDKVITIGGVVGTAVEVRDDEITVKVDDGTRMKFARWAIRTAGDDIKNEKKEDSQKK